jgi:hypothetical protein
MERGQTLMEFALVVPILLIVLLMIVDFGFAIDRREMVQHAVREGARHAAVGNGVASVTDHTSEQSGGILSNIVVCYIDDNPDNPLGRAGDTVQVSGQYTYDFMVGNGTLMDGAIPSISMTPSSQARLERNVPGASAC